MTPMIDVVFLLIIFFLVSSHLSRRENRMPVSLADSATGISETSPADDVFTLTMDAQARLFLNGSQLSTDVFSSRLPRDSTQTVRIRVDRSLAYEHLNRVLATLTDRGFQNVSIVTSPIAVSRP
ncbi:biopolymer transport protein ExbD [Neorhodopirellula pilleata]|uniref:Biopolymer transport protein ExbD n=2 Tax=Neorhodopirellula pilleata TaxID=2714738 RepID=A0A5C6ARF9_9BACT|nr:biopolymer transport protein ExbD [Neorhodopirellula pilleata]